MDARFKSGDEVRLKSQLDRAGKIVADPGSGTDDDNGLIGYDIPDFSSVKNRLDPKNRPGI